MTSTLKFCGNCTMLVAPKYQTHPTTSVRWVALHPSRWLEERPPSRGRGLFLATQTTPSTPARTHERTHIVKVNELNQSDTHIHAQIVCTRVFGMNTKVNCGRLVVIRERKENDVTAALRAAVSCMHVRMYERRRAAPVQASLARCFHRP